MESERRAATKRKSGLLAARTPSALYTGLAIASTPAPLLYATDFHNATINAINGSFTSATLPGNFTDPNLPAGYAPFNIQTLAGKLFVSLRDARCRRHDPRGGCR